MGDVWEQRDCGLIGSPLGLWSERPHHATNGLWVPIIFTVKGDDFAQILTGDAHKIPVKSCSEISLQFVDSGEKSRDLDGMKVVVCSSSVENGVISRNKDFAAAVWSPADLLFHPNDRDWICGNGILIFALAQSRCNCAMPHVARPSTWGENKHNGTLWMNFITMG